MIGKRSSILYFAFVSTLILFFVLFHLYLLQIESVLPHVDPIANKVLMELTLIHNIVSTLNKRGSAGQVSTNVV